VTYLGGLHAALWLLGALTPFAAVGLLVALVVLADVPHRVRVARLHRDARRAGRATVADRPAQPLPCHCAHLPPGRRDLTGHEPGCPDHPSTSDYVRAANR
jgi:hypothetical protein